MPDGVGHTATLCYRGSEHSFLVSEYWAATGCVNKENRVAIVKFKDHDFLFGGFATEAQVHTGYAGYNLAGTFTFSMLKDGTMTRYNLISGNYAEYLHTSYGPTFGDHEMYVSDSCDDNTSSYINPGVAYDGTKDFLDG